MHTIDAVQLEYMKGLEAFRYWELKEVVTKLSEHGITVMLLKGAVELAVPEYRPSGSPPRQMGDIDLLVHETDWQPAVRVLKELGYSPVINEISKETCLPIIGQRDFLRNSPQGRIDLHYDLNRSPAAGWCIDSDEMWAKAREIEFAGGFVFIPSLTDHVWYQLVHLLLFHTFSHEMLFGDNGLMWSLIAKADHLKDHVDWSEISSKAERCNAEIALHFTVFGMRSHYNELPGIEINEEMIQYVACVWKWARDAFHKPAILTHALGRYTVLTLIRKYRVGKLLDIYFSEIVKGVLKKDLLAKYRVSGFPFLYPMVYLIHFIRLVLLHAIAGVMHAGFIQKEKREH